MKQDVSVVSWTTFWACGPTICKVLSKAFLAGLLMGALVGCASGVKDGLAPDSAKGMTPPRVAAQDTEAWRSAVGDILLTPAGGEPWQPFLLPGKRFASFELVNRLEVPSLSVQADRSVSILRRRFAQALPEVGNIDFSWKIDGLPDGASLRETDREDAPVRVLLTFDGDKSKWSARNHRLSEMSRLLVGEDLPYATLMYVWSIDDALGSVVVNPRSDRIRKVVVESGTAEIGRWRKYSRDIRADFLRAFGEEPGPRLAVALMTDTDNTRSTLKAWYGPLQLLAPAVAR
jgi:hypothetical protein